MDSPATQPSVEPQVPDMEDFPVPGSPIERQRFRELQQKMRQQFEKVFPDMAAKKTVVVIPSLTIDQELQSRVAGGMYYEERLLALLMLLACSLLTMNSVTAKRATPPTQ